MEERTGTHIFLWPLDVRDKSMLTLLDEENAIDRKCKWLRMQTAHGHAMISDTERNVSQNFAARLER